MNTLTRWNPFKEMEEMQRRLSAAFNILPERNGSSSGGGKESMIVAEWSPLVDITEDDREYLITAELPEVKKEDVKVTVESGVLQISGERKFEQEEKTKRYHRVERSYGSFVRSFTLPGDVDDGRVSAEFKDGVLKVHVAKSEKALPKQVEVKVS